MATSQVPMTTGTVIATGYNCQVRIGENETDAAKHIIALATSWQVTEDFQVQEAVVLGHLGPISIDPQGYTCNVTIDGYLPAAGFDNIATLFGQGTESLAQNIPSRDEFMTDGAMPKIAYMDFYNHKEGKPIIGLTGVLVTSSGISAEGNSYVRNNVQLRALSTTRTKPAK